MIRTPAVANQFYSGDPAQLKRDLSSLMAPSSNRYRAIGIISPHAGYIYSGGVAGELYGTIVVPETVIVLGPNHHGRGVPASLYPDGEWSTPLGKVPINSRLSELVRYHAPMVEEDTAAHEYEHSLEVQIPFLQYCQPGLSIVPLCLGFGDYQSCRDLGLGLAGAIREFAQDVLIVASSDMSHYESAEAAQSKDELALDRAMAIDPEGLLSVCRAKRITMCGVVPAAVMLVAAKELGATRACLVRYANSGEVNGDFRRVVGYAGVTVS